MPRHCPACRNVVPEDALDCPFCPMSFRGEDEEGGGRRRRGHIPGWVKVGALAVGIGAVGYQIWLGLSFVMSHADSAMGTGEPSQQTRPFQSQTPPAEATAPAPPPAVSYHLSDRPEENEAPVVSVTRASDEDSRPVTSWRLRGAVYDLETLKPVSGAYLTFLDVDSPRRYQTSTDSSGRYRLTVKPLHLHGYNVKISRSGYAEEYLDPATQGVRRMSQENRHQRCLELARSLNGPYEIEPPGAEPLVTDFYIAPLLR